MRVTMTTSTATQASSAATDALLTLEGVSKIYGDLHALDNVSLEIPRGQWVSIVGPSGSGKTTLMNIVGAMDTATKGTVMLDGHDISDLTADELTEVRCRTIGLVFQQFHLIGHLTALENIMVAQYYHSMPDEKEALEALDRVGLADRATHLPRQLSGGEQQRLRFALALLPDPDLLILDEPTAGMDVRARRDFWREIRAEAQAGRTILFATHYLDEVDEFADRVILIKEGRVIADDTADAIRTTAGGCTVSAELTPGTLDRIGLAGTRLLEERSGRTYLHNPDSDALTRRLLELGGRGIRVVPRSLDDAFLALTSTTTEN